MGTLRRSEANSRVSSYMSEIDRVKEQLQKNFNDMDFENANRRSEMGDIITEMKRTCRVVQEHLDTLSFE